MSFDQVVLFLFILSEALALIPSIKANGVFQLIVNIIQKLVNPQQTTPK